MDEQRTYLIGEAYRAQKMTQGTNNQYVQGKSEKPQNGVFQKDNRTAKIIAKEFGVGSSTVDRASQFVESFDAAETVSTGFKEAILAGTIKPPKMVLCQKAMRQKIS